MGSDSAWGTTSSPNRQNSVCVLTAEEEAATEPSPSMLSRVKLEVEKLQDDLRAQLAHEAECLLGYKVLREDMRLPGPLALCLAALDIEPLREANVENYQKEMIVWHRAEMKRKGTWTAVSRLAWVETAIQRYNQPIPEFVLSRCVQIKKAMQEIAPATAPQFIVEHLMDVDPFMEVQVGDESWYIDVWGESKFEVNL